MAARSLCRMPRDTGSICRKRVENAHPRSVSAGNYGSSEIKTLDLQTTSANSVNSHGNRSSTNVEPAEIINWEESSSSKLFMLTRIRYCSTHSRCDRKLVAADTTSVRIAPKLSCWLLPGSVDQPQHSLGEFHRHLAHLDNP